MQSFKATSTNPEFYSHSSFYFSGDDSDRNQTYFTDLGEAYMCIVELLEQTNKYNEPTLNTNSSLSCGSFLASYYGLHISKNFLYYVQPTS
ncbi:transcription factor HBP-1b(c38)-like [Pyrus ussuriensis x Pyrus communis]|uniref:Transcription factor HBP-1b(C38)-like n=1 Tax=Pyrus ussuriensis x Pyrus communis TaxID=2448454 RepID=A0A5N5H8M6_9ROSA|nr:transcription factor HBP-1b(c38)-like [Pyrus ussuriensis x Pyrus communis]